MIDIQNLTFSYSKSQHLFEGLSQQLVPGKIYGLLGKNGTGKSTLLKLINGIIFPKSGKINVDSFAAQDRHPDMLAEIFFLSENYELPALTDKGFVKAHAPFYAKFDHEQFERNISTFEVPTNKRLDKMSLGQKKKFIIAFGIATNAKYLLLDEPTNGLDIPSKSQFRKVIASGFNDDQIVIISTHQIRDLSKLIESMIIIESGKIIFSKDLFEVEEKLLFTKSLSEKGEGNPIYSELIGGAYVHLYPNQNKTPSEIELEVLFNAILTEDESINQLIA